MLCDKSGIPVPSSRLGALEEFRIRPENTSHRAEKILVRYLPGKGFELAKRTLRDLEDTGKIYFEKNWGAYLTGTIYPGDRQTAG